MARDLSEAFDILKEHDIDLGQWVLDTNAETMLRIGSLLDEFLEIALKVRTVRIGGTVQDEPYQKDGKLQTLGAKITKAKNVGILDEATWKDADMLREIRNEFGHPKTKVNFDSPEIEKWAKRLSTYDETKPNQAAILGAMTKVTDRLRASVKPELVKGIKR
jgi:hypothetical protein